VYFLDSDILVGFLRSNKDAMIKIKSLLDRNSELFTSSINLHELIKGANLSNNPANNTEKVEELMRTIVVLPFDRKCAEISGKLSAGKKIRSKPIGQNDLLIASVAINYNLKLVTRNKKHFDSIPGLNLEEW
jgi:tRNA(fMet)-specific endonuclease VapC